MVDRKRGVSEKEDRKNGSIDFVLAKLTEHSYDEPIPESSGLRKVEDPETFRNYIYDPGSKKILFGGGYIQLDYIGILDGKHIARAYNLEEYNEEENDVAIIDETGRLLFGGWYTAIQAHKLPALNFVDSKKDMCQMIFDDNEHTTWDWESYLKKCERLPKPKTIADFLDYKDKECPEEDYLAIQTAKPRKITDNDILIIVNTEKNSISLVNENGNVLLDGVPNLLESDDDLKAKQIRFFQDGNSKKVEIKYGPTYNSIFEVNKSGIYDLLDIQETRERFLNVLQKRSELQ